MQNSENYLSIPIDMAQELSNDIENFLQKIQNSELVGTLPKLAESISTRIMTYDQGVNSDTDLFCHSIAKSNVTVKFIKMYELKKKC